MEFEYLLNIYYFYLPEKNILMLKHAKKKYSSLLFMFSGCVYYLICVNVCADCWGYNYSWIENNIF